MTNSMLCGIMNKWIGWKCFGVVVDAVFDVTAG
jgi:hypothetical protein